MDIIQFQSKNILKASPVIILISTILVWLVTNQVVALRFAGYYLITEFCVSIMKQINGVIAKDSQYIYRPKGAGNCTGCDAFTRYTSECIDVSAKIGMPSGHSAAAIMAATFWSLWIWNNTCTISTVSKISRIIVLYVFALLVAASRTMWLENCHTIPQVIVGCIFGLVSGIGFYILDAKGRAVL